MLICVFNKLHRLNGNSIQYNLITLREKKYIPVYNKIVKYRQQFSKKNTSSLSDSTHKITKDSTLNSTEDSKDEKLVKDSTYSIRKDIEDLINLKYTLPTTISNVYDLFHTIHRSTFISKEPLSSNLNLKSEPGISENNKSYGKQIYLNIFLNLDIRRTSLRGNLLLPFIVSNKKKILAICEKEDEQLVLKNGATYAGLSYLDRIENGWLDFDTLLTTTLFMPKLVKLARILGPKKLMPNAKSGTLCNDLISGIKKLSSNNSVQYRAESITQDEYNLLTQIMDINSNINNLKRDKEDWDDRKSLELCKVVIPISILENTIEQLTSNIQFFMHHISTTNVGVIKKETNKNFIYPPKRKTNIFGDDEDSSLDGSSKSDFVLSIALTLKDFPNQLFFLNSNLF